MKHLKALLFVITLTLLVRAPARASTNVVTTAADSGIGSLRAAVSNAVSGDTIVFTNTLSGMTILLTHGEIVLTNNLTIDGASLAVPVQINGNRTSRIFHVERATVTLNSLVITNGYTNDYGGGILSARSILTLNNTTVAGNSGYYLGGGIISYSSSVLTLNQCTVSSNSVLGSGFSGGIYAVGTATLNNCTVVGNSGYYQGAGIQNDGVMTLINSTVVSNWGGGIYAGFGPEYVTILTNCIVAANTDGYFSNANFIGSYTGTNNLVGGNPQLAPLGYYGGPTMTMPPLPGSPAVDAGDDTAASQFITDQRGSGFARKIGTHVDIGAAEGVYVANYSGPGLLTGATRLNNGAGAFRFGFTNYTDMSLTVWASTNLALPLAQWSNLGAPSESPAGSGNFQFTDPQSLTNEKSFYRVSSP